MCSLQGRCRRRGASDEPAPVLHPQFWGRSDGCAAPRRGRGHARPVPHWQIWVCSDWCMAPCREHIYVFRNCRFAPESGAFCRLSLPGRAWPGPYMARRNGLDAFKTGGPVPAEHINVFPTGPVAAVGVHPTNQTAQQIPIFHFSIIPDFSPEDNLGLAIFIGICYYVAR